MIFQVLSVLFLLVTTISKPLNLKKIPILQRNSDAQNYHMAILSVFLLNFFNSWFGQLRWNPRATNLCLLDFTD